MDIKNIYTNAKEEVIDFLLRFLSKHNISYVRVEDEVHFLDKIYRFYDSKDNSLDYILEEMYNVLYDLEVSKRLSIDDDFKKYIISEERADNKYPILNYGINKKKLIKMQNRGSNLKLKNSRK